MGRHPVVPCRRPVAAKSLLRSAEIWSVTQTRIALLSSLLWAAAWAWDMFTPQRLVAAILLTVPVAIASLYLERRLSQSFIVAALSADGIAGWFNGVGEGGHWDGASIANRALAGLSIVLVGILGSMARAAAQESGRLAARQTLFGELARKNDELIAANSSLEDRSTVIREIVYALSHDLRTPLAAAAMTLQQAIDGKFGALPPDYHEILRRSVESNNELRRLAETLLIVARYESGEQSTLRCQVAMDRLVRSVVKELEPLWASKRLAVEIDGSGTMAVLADEGELRRAIVNLLANAIRATPDGGHIALRHFKRMTSPRYRLKTPATECEKSNARFYSSGSRSAARLRMGYATGSACISFAGSPNSMAARFRIVRACLTEACSRSNRRRSLGTMMTHSAVQVTIVEDHSLTRAGLRRALADAGFDIVSEAADGLRGWADVERLNPDVAVIDVGLPGMDGIELTRRIRSGRLRTRVVMLTMHDQDTEVLAALAAGADAYCVKSGSSEDAITAVRAAADGGAYFDPAIAHISFVSLVRAARENEAKRHPSRRGRRRYCG